MKINRKVLFERPKNSDGTSYRFFILSNSLYLLFLLVHLCFIPLFIFLDITSLIYFNIISVPLYYVVLRKNLSGQHLTALFLVTIEVVVHAGIASYTIGEVGIRQALVFNLIMAVLYPGRSRPKILLITLIAISFVFLNLYDSTTTPINTLNIYVFYALRASVAALEAFIAGYLAFYYVRAATAVESDLEKVIEERLKAENKLSEAYDIIKSSIKYASRIQHSILPFQQVLDKAIPNRMVVWEPRDVVGGDMYWCHTWGDGHLIILGDCTGHGVPGAFMTLISNGALDQACLEVEPGNPAKLISRIHQLIQNTLNQHMNEGESDDGLELGVCYVPVKRDKLTFSGARFSLFYGDINSTIIELKGDKQGTGYRGIPQDTTFTNHHIDIIDGRRFYMTSDGLLDQVGGKKRRGFGKKRFKNLLDQLSSLPLVSQGDTILAELSLHQGEEMRRDDVSLIGFTFS
ncbi:MAG: SpoIIE family protein phosphatase [Magnetococcales bacterium]|nr:SpoIIE family protein phosphatase [Magnetococcales bacterium]